MCSHNPVTPLGWPTYYTEDYAAQSQAFQAAGRYELCLPRHGSGAPGHHLGL